MPVLKKEETIWFDFPDDPLGGAIEVRYLNEGQKAELKEKTNPTQAKLNSENNIEVNMDMNAVRTREETAVAYIKDWKNFFDGKKVKGHPNGKEMGCTRANKIRFSSEDGFMDFLTDCIIEVKKIVNKQKEKEAKNLTTSQDG